MRLLTVALFGIGLNGCVYYEGYGCGDDCGWGDWCEEDCDDWDDWCDFDCEDEDDCESECEDTGDTDIDPDTDADTDADTDVDSDTDADTDVDTDTDPIVEIDYWFDPGAGEQGESMITSLFPSDEFDMTTVVDLTFFGDLTVDALSPRDDEVLVVLTIDCDAPVGFVDALVEFDDGSFEILDDSFEILEKIVDTGEECECP